MIKISNQIQIPETEVKFTFIRSPGPGGQNVNKVATAVLLRFNVVQSPSIPETIRLRFLSLFAQKLTAEGECMIKANRYRSQERNKQDAIRRLAQLLNQASVIPKRRKKTKPSKSSIEKRIQQKKQQALKKTLRGKWL